MAAPARKLKKSSVKNIVRFPAIKSNGGKSILVESILESKYCLLLEFDSEVQEYYPQPKTFQVPLPDTVDTFLYTPDFEVHFMSGEKIYVEVKPFEIASTEKYQELFLNFKNALKDTEYSFKVVTDREILSEPRSSNLQKLFRYKNESLDLQKIYQIAEQYSVKPTISYLLKKHPNELTILDIYIALAKGFLVFDCGNESLDINTEVTFNV